MKTVAVITGASKGIGLSTAQLFLAHDWSVINISRTEADVVDIKNVAVDLYEIENYRRQLSELIKEPTRICLVHNASMYIKDAIPTLNADELKKMLTVNIIAPAILNQFFLPKMRSNRNNTVFN